MAEALTSASAGATANIPHILRIRKRVRRVNERKKSQRKMWHNLGKGYTTKIEVCFTCKKSGVGHITIGAFQH